MKYRLFVSVDEYDTQEEAIEAGIPFEQDGESTIIKEVVEI